MIDAQQIDTSDLRTWKRINMRNVDHLLGVEFIHDLYNRHEPTINSVRFRNTVTTWKDGIVNSYAPQSEWERLGEVLGQEFYSLSPVLIQHTRRLYRRKREHYHSFIRRLKRTKFSLLANDQLATVLINFQSLVLGELYVLNFVQIEHGLNLAVKRALLEVTQSQERSDALFMTLIQTQVPTKSQEERYQLYLLAKKWRVVKRLQKNWEQAAQKDVLRHCEKYAYLYSAYGETPKSYDDFWQDFLQYFNGSKISCRPQFMPRLMTRAAKKALRGLRSKKLSVLVPLLVRGGVFRDTNKALLGQSVKYRFAILDEIARRKLESRSNLNYYLLTEIIDLLRNETTIDQRVINQRRQEGIVITRNESIAIFVQDKSVDQAMAGNTLQLRGQCASPGGSEGIARIVLTKNDTKKVHDGDIMIAIGTDFDLIEAMCRSSAVVTEEGGILSHASVVCRELSKPCCIAVKDVTRLIPDGARIRVDATQGKITVLS